MTSTPNAPRSAALSGTVKGPDGKPVAGARVIAKPSRHWGEALVTRTGDAGRFNLAVPPKLGPWDVRVEAPGLAAAQLERVAAGAGLDVRLTRGKTLTGVVRDGRDGRPLSGVRIEARARASWAFGGGNDPTLGLVSARTDHEGRFRILGVGLGFFDVEARTAGYGAAKRPEVAAGATVDLLLFPAASIAGVVLGPGRHPVRGALVRAERRSDPASVLGLEVTDARGRFLIAGVEPGSYVVKARHPDLAPGRRDVEVAALSEAQVEVELASGVAATGRLTDGQGRPVQGRVTLLEFGAPPWNLPLAPQPNVGADGRFAVAHVPAGEHAIAVQAPGYTFQRVPIEVGPRDAGLDLGAVVLDRGAALTGRVTDPAGAPIEGATVSARRCAMGRRSRARTSGSLRRGSQRKRRSCTTAAATRGSRPMAHSSSNASRTGR
jgi:protocatechuate 3,4-dioxygenase beta subunit